MIVAETAVVEETAPVIAAALTPASSGPPATVVSGETYQSISSQYYGTTRKWRQIQGNDANQYGLMPGMVLTIPAVEDPVAVSVPVTGSLSTSGPRTYKCNPEIAITPLPVTNWVIRSAIAS